MNRLLTHSFRAASYLSRPQPNAFDLSVLFHTWKGIFRFCKKKIHNMHTFDNTVFPDIPIFTSMPVQHRVLENAASFLQNEQICVPYWYSNSLFYPTIERKKNHQWVSSAIVFSSSFCYFAEWDAFVVCSVCNAEFFVYINFYCRKYKMYENNSQKYIAAPKKTSLHCWKHKQECWVWNNRNRLFISDCMWARIRTFLFIAFIVVFQRTIKRWWWRRTKKK